MNVYYFIFTDTYKLLIDKKIIFIGKAVANTDKVNNVPLKPSYQGNQQQAAQYKQNLQVLKNMIKEKRNEQNQEQKRKNIQEIVVVQPLQKLQ